MTTDPPLKDRRAVIEAGPRPQHDCPDCTHVVEPMLADAEVAEEIIGLDQSEYPPEAWTRHHGPLPLSLGTLTPGKRYVWRSRVGLGHGTFRVVVPPTL